jgi:hypothetical protein
MNEWYRQRRERVRIRSLNRIMTSLELKDGDPSEAAKANMGIYGIGRRRSLAQLDDFVGVNLAEGIGNAQVKCCILGVISLHGESSGIVNLIFQNMKCANLKFVPFDPQVSPTDNLYVNANDLDTQPEYPMRTDLKFYKQVEQIIEPPLSFDFEMNQDSVSRTGGLPTTEKYPFPPASTMLTLWFMGLTLWCIFYMNSAGRKARRKKGSGLKNV